MNNSRSITKHLLVLLSLQREDDGCLSEQSFYAHDHEDIIISDGGLL
jgi:hypothetical protein